MISTFVTPAIGSPFDPHPLKTSAEPFFEGWFARVIDHERGRSASFIVGAFQPAGSSGFTQLWAALLMHGNGVAARNATVANQILSLQTDALEITRQGRPIVTPPARSAPAQFEVRAPGISLTVANDRLALNVSLGGASLRMNTSRRLPWDPSEPDGPGPEGWIGATASWLLPCHYYVQSFASETDYEIGGLPGGPIGGHGLAHLETNYGTAFPDAWTWAQAVGETASLGRFALLLTRMELPLGGLPPTTQSIVALRAGNRSWDFRDVDLDMINMTADGCAGTLLLDAATPVLPDRPPARRLQLALRAPPTSFSEALYFPTRSGFNATPGAAESYAAAVQVTAFEHGVKVTAFEVSEAALEFGGRWKCAGGSVED